jgi:hypothetical protein
MMVTKKLLFSWGCGEQERRGQLHSNSEAVELKGFLLEPVHDLDIVTIGVRPQNDDEQPQFFLRKILEKRDR